MVVFDQLRISDSGKRMYISVHVNRADVFEDVYLESITIMTADKVFELSYPETPTTDSIYYQEFEKDSKGHYPKEIALVLTANNFMRSYEKEDAINFKQSDMSRTLFFVYIKAHKEGWSDKDCCIPCRLDEEYTVGVTFDESLLYQRVMDFTRELAEDCIIPQGFTDFILLWNAFKASIETEHFIPAIEYFNMLFGNTVGGIGINGSINSRRKCGCHG